MSVILIISIPLAISVTVYVIVTPKEGELIIGVVNHEYDTVTYPLELKLNGEVIDKKSIVLTHNETWEKTVTFRATKAGEDQKLEFLLYKEGVNNVYRSLHLWMDVI